MAVTDKSWEPAQPISGCEQITPSSNFFTRTRAISVTVDGDYTIQFRQGDPVTISLIAGVVYPFSIVKCTAVAPTGAIFGLW